MVCTEHDLSNWENFPKGLRVLLLDAEADAASKLQSMDYIVTTFTDENEALSAFSEKPESFHIAIVEVNTSDKNKSFEFLEAAKDLPTIMTSRDHCLTTMMKCIALGAVEFLHKPLSDDKLNNIWQHVLHKAFNDRGSRVSGSLKPVKESVVSTLYLEGEDPRGKDSNADERDPAPSTPQLKQGSRLLDDKDRPENDGNCSMENVNYSSEKESREVESKSVETTDANHAVVKEERDEGEGETDEARSGNKARVDRRKNKKEDGVKDRCKPSNKPSGIKNVAGNKANRKKVDWTPELHKKFVLAVEQLGVDQAIPSRILELMKVEGLTRHNVASHLQKFRMHRRNILPKGNHHHDRRWIHGHHHRHGQMQRSPVMAYPVAPMFPVWGTPPPPAMWPPPSSGYPLPWQPPSSCWHWKPPFPPAHGNAWGCPIGPPAIRPPCNNTSQEEEEEIDKVVKEAMSKPWLVFKFHFGKPSGPHRGFSMLSDS
ncbi:PREDICTED: two-component response regulator-like APRR2 [Tarenaya hassleriana]|uniref:two-component response regulator-like APRR2 n=1 Tax=Tarenaya hassleriana TaxID=28532 RepID=UPI00053C8B44|nr:PREDICTED: two-component response regulator-like APRR2 [Tarenaya hassleriana]